MCAQDCDARPADAAESYDNGEAGGTLVLFPKKSQQSQNQAAREMMLSLFDADFGRSRLAIRAWTIKQRRASWTQEES